jgi:hypothetical protein
MLTLTEDQLPQDLQSLLALWRSRCETRRFPRWQDLQPDDLLPWTDRLHVIEQLDDGDFYFHRFSPISAARMGEDMTGRRLSEIILNNRAAQSTSSYRRCLILARPCSDRIPADFGDGPQHTTYDRLLLPFGEGDKPHQLLAGLHFPD